MTENKLRWFDWFYVTRFIDTLHKDLASCQLKVASFSAAGGAVLGYFSATALQNLFASLDKAISHALTAQDRSCLASALSGMYLHDIAKYSLTFGVVHSILPVIYSRVIENYYTNIVNIWGKERFSYLNSAYEGSEKENYEYALKSFFDWGNNIGRNMHILVFQSRLSYVSYKVSGALGLVVSLAHIVQSRVVNPIMLHAYGSVIGEVNALESLISQRKNEIKKEGETPRPERSAIERVEKKRERFSKHVSKET